jgi:hypothetical protein
MFQKPTGLELIRGSEDWQLAFVPESGCTPKTVKLEIQEKDGRKGRRNRMARRKERRQEGNTYGKMLSEGWRGKKNLGGKCFLLIPVVSSDLQC